jgi:hypothetical protein
VDPRLGRRRLRSRPFDKFAVIFARQTLRPLIHGFEVPLASIFAWQAFDDWAAQEFEANPAPRASGSGAFEPYKP